MSRHGIPTYLPGNQRALLVKCRILDSNSSGMRFFLFYFLYLLKSIVTYLYCFNGETGYIFKMSRNGRASDGPQSYLPKYAHRSKISECIFQMESCPIRDSKLLHSETRGERFVDHCQPISHHLPDSRCP